MINQRIIPCLQLIDQSLVKTIKFKNPQYIGDPINSVRIFNELEVDELCFLDIRATIENRKPNFKILKEIASECFMPLSYGGGIRDISTALEIISIGFEKIIINTAAINNPKLISEISSKIGAQSTVASLDFKRNIFGKYRVYSNSGTINSQYNPIDWAIKLQNLGAGEILITSIDREGTWAGQDIEIVKKIANSVSIPIISNGGCGSVEDIIKLTCISGVSVALGSMVVYQAKDLGVLINLPNREIIFKASL